LHNNFNNGTRCLTVNGWFVAVQRQDGAKKVNGKEIAWKKGDVAWHSYVPMSNQMVVMEQFDQSPVVLFTTRYNEPMPNGANRWTSVTQSLHKATGKLVYDSGHRTTNGQAMFSMFQIDLKSRTINLISYSQSVQHFVDEGKGPPALPQQGAMANPLQAFIPVELRDQVDLGGGFVAPGGGARLQPVPPVIIRRPVDREIQVLPVEKR